MAHYEQVHRTPFTPRQLFALVADVEQYPAFCPGYEAATIERREGDRLFVAQTIRVGLLSIHFHSIALLDPHRSITIRGTDRFQELAVSWRFRPIEAGCEVGFSLHLGRPPIPAPLLAPWFGLHSKRLVAAFLRRAEIVYGAPPGPPPR